MREYKRRRSIVDAGGGGSLRICTPPMFAMASAKSSSANISFASRLKCDSASDISRAVRRHAQSRNRMRACARARTPEYPPERFAMGSRATNGEVRNKARDVGALGRQSVAQPLW